MTPFPAHILNHGMSSGQNRNNGSNERPCRLARQLPTAAAVVEVRAGFNKNNRERALPNLLFPCLASSFSSPCAHVLLSVSLSHVSSSCSAPPLPGVQLHAFVLLLVAPCPSSLWRQAPWPRPLSSVLETEDLLCLRTSVLHTSLKCL